MKQWRIWGLVAVLVAISTWVYTQSNLLAITNNNALADAQAGQWREAQNQFYTAQVLAPDEPLPYFNYATLLIAQNDWSKAEQALLQGTRTDDDSIRAKAYYNLGNLYYGTGQYALAIDAYQQTLRINPQADNARHNLELTMRRAVQPTQTPSSADTSPPTPTPPPDTDGDTPSTIDGDGDMIELLPTIEPIGAMSVEDAEELLNQLQLDEQALNGAVLPDNPVTLPEKDW